MASARLYQSVARRRRRLSSSLSMYCRNTWLGTKPGGRWHMDGRSSYLRDGAAIYQRSFTIIRAEADLAGFSTEEADVVVRMIHACGLVEAARQIVFGGGLVVAARDALAAGAPLLCDSEMVADGIKRARAPAGNH